MLCSGDGRDVMNVTRLCSGNDSDFMEMTECVGGMMADDADLLEMLSPDVEQENNVNYRAHDVGLVDAHNKSPFFDDDHEEHDVSLSICVGNIEVASSEPAPPVSACPSYAAPHGGDSLDNVGESDSDMTMTQCLPLGLSTRMLSDMELTECLPADISSAGVKSSGRWPFGKRQDGRRDSSTRYEDRRTSDPEGVQDEGSFVDTDELDASMKIDTAALLMELNMTPVSVENGKVDSASDQIHEISSVTSSAVSLPSALSMSVTGCPVASASNAEMWPANDKPLDGRMEQSMDCSCYNSVDDEGVNKTRDERGQCSVSSSGPEEHQLSESNSSKELLPCKTGGLSVTSGVDQWEHISAGLLTKLAVEADDTGQTVACVASDSWLLSAAAVTSTRDEAVVLSVSSLAPALVSEVDSFSCKLLSDDVENRSSQLADQPVNIDVGDVSVSIAGPVHFTADAVVSLFAPKDSNETVGSNLAAVENATMTADTADHLPGLEREMKMDSRELEWSASSSVSGRDTSGLTASVRYETSAQKPLKSAVQTAMDDLLTRVRLANSVSHQTTSNASALRSFRHSLSTIKPTSTSAFRPANKTLPLSSSRRVFTPSAFQPYEPDVDRTKELVRHTRISGCEYLPLGVSGDSSRMDISARSMELTDTLPTGLVSFSLTENNEVTRRDEVSHLEPIKNVTSISSETQSTSFWAGGGGGDNTLAETPADGNAELLKCLPSVESHSQSDGGGLLPLTTAVAELSSVATSSVNSVRTLSEEQCGLDTVGDVSLACGMTSCCVDMETSVDRHLPPVVVPVKLSSNSSDETLSLPPTDVSQSSVFCAEACVTNFTYVLPQGVPGGTSESSGQVRVRWSVSVAVV